MFITGVFRLQDTVFNLEIVDVQGDYRLDFYREKTIVPCFSLRRRLKTYVRGEQYIYDQFMRIQTDAANAPGKYSDSTTITDNTWVRTLTKINNDIQLFQEVTYHNGQMYSTHIRVKDASLNYSVSSYDSHPGQMGGASLSDYKTLILQEQCNSTAFRPHFSVDALYTRFNIAHIDSNDFVVADDINTARQRLYDYDSAGDTLRGFDTETTGLDVNMYGEDKLLGVVLSFSTTQSTYFPFRHDNIQNLPMSFLAEIMGVVIKHENNTIAHNKKFDRKVMTKEGFDLRVKYDTMIMSCLLNPVMSKGTHSLKSLIYKFDKKRYLELEDIFNSKKNINFSVLPKDIVRIYACPDASNVISLYHHLNNQFPNHLRNICDVEFALADLKADQEYYGLRVDMPNYETSKKQNDDTIAVLEDKFRLLTRFDGNMTSVPQLSDLIYNKMHCPILLRTGTGQPSTGKAAIAKLASKKRKDAVLQVEDITTPDGTAIVKGSDLGNAQYPSLLILDKYRKAVKLKTAFFNRFESTKSGRIFFWINQNGAQSGRQSSPMHQLPSTLKKLIIADSPDYNFFDADYSQIELRMLAFLAGQKDLLELCEDPENDIHRVIGSLISGKEMWEISASERKVGKIRNFGVVYMMSKRGLADNLHGAGSSEDNNKVSEAAGLITDFFTRFKRIQAYIENNKRKVQRDGEISTFFGRSRKFDEIFDEHISSRKRASLLRQANNTPVQGTAADYLKISEVNFYNYIRNKGWNKLYKDFPYCRIALSIHDEVIIMAHKSIPIEEVILMIKTCMEMPIEGAPPFFCSPALVNNWDGHNDDAAVMPVKLRDCILATYQRTGISTLTSENWLKTINDYRDTLLCNYMQSLISQFNHNVEHIANNVRHPTLTHELLSRYPSPKGLSHTDAILHAVTQYMSNETPQQVSIPTEHYQAYQPLESLVNLDKDGNVLFEQDYEDDSEFVEPDIGMLEVPAIWEIGDVLVVDLSSASAETGDKVLAELWKYRATDGFFKVNILVAGDITDTGFRVEDFPRKKIEEMILC
jgi:DNA polymerase I-like protein with 3'-5' exonuclease and polymerase domains